MKVYLAGTQVDKYDLVKSNHGLYLLESFWYIKDSKKNFYILKEVLKISGEGLSKTKVEDNSDYLGSTSVETLSPSDQLAVGG